MSIQFDIAKQIIAETCPNRKLKLENIRLFADIIQPKKYQKGDIILNEGVKDENRLLLHKSNRNH